jgi:hypothetical protein
MKGQLQKNAFVDISFYPGEEVGALAKGTFTLKQKHTRLLNLKQDANYSASLLRQLRKGQQQISFLESADSALLWQFMQRVYSSRGSALQLKSELLQKAVNMSLKGAFGSLTYAVDNENNYHAALWTVWDETTMYYVAGARNEARANSAAMSCLLDAAINSARAKGLSNFDFCGSSIEGIDRFFAGFGAEKIPVVQLQSAAPWWWKLIRKGARTFKRIID